MQADGAATALTQRVTIGVLGVQAALATALLGYSFFNSELAPNRGTITIGVLLFVVILGLYLRGWPDATRLGVIAVSLVIGLGVPAPFDAVSLVVVLGPVLAMIVAGPRWVIAAAILTLSLVIVRGGAVYAEPANLILFAMIVAGTIAGQLVLTAEARARAKSDARLRAFLHGSPVMIFTTDRDGVCDFFAGGHLETLGLRASAIVGRSMVDGDAQVHGLASVVTTALTGDSGSRQLEFADRYLMLRYAPIGEASDLQGVIGVAADVTENILAIDALRGSEERLAAVTEELPVLVLAVNPDGAIWRSDGLGLRALGFGTGGLDGRSVFDLFAGDAARHAFTEATAGRLCSTTVIRDGRSIELHCVPRGQPSGAPTGFTVAAILDH